MAEANAECDEQNAKIALYETQKQTKITNACSALTTEELRGANDDGLNFATLNAGCLALDPNYTCSLQGLMNCVGGPLQRTPGRADQRTPRSAGSRRGRRDRTAHPVLGARGHAQSEGERS